MRKLVLLAIAIVAAHCGMNNDPGSSSQYSITFDSITVAPATERTQCITRRLGNPTAVLGPASHHMIVYKVSDTTESATPVECQPFQDTFDPTKGVPLMITQKSDDLLTLPTGVAYSIDANQMIRVELHYINAGSADVTISATTTMTAIADADFQHEAGFLFAGNPDIYLPPMTRVTLGPTFLTLPSDLAGVNFFAITGHEHRLGTNVSVRTAANSSDPGTSVYDVAGWQWSEPATVFANPTFQLPDNGGFSFTCEWNNWTSAPVEFGASANDEMCFFWAYYYPNKGARLCMHTDTVPGGADICCPGGDAQFCSRFGS
jgi:hypothetical protein